MSDPYLPKISRRTTLQWLAAAIAGTAIPRRAEGQSPPGEARLGATPAPEREPDGRLAIFKPTPKGYGPDPNLNHPVIPWDRIMSQRELRVTAALADLILPATATAPAPSALGIPDFINEWVSAPYPSQVRDRETLLSGLASLDAEANRRWSKGFLEIEDLQKQKMLDLIIQEWKVADPRAAGSTFFCRFRAVALGAYYTTPEGYKDIRYLGNVPLESYPPATAEELAILEREFKKLGVEKATPISRS